MFPYSQVILVCWAVWWAYWLGAALWNRKAAVRRESQASWLSWRLLTIAAGIFLFCPLRIAGLDTHFLATTNLWGCLGLGLTLAGLVYAVWARRVLGSNWSSTVTVKEEHELIQSGPYAYTRHPIYTGLLTAALGTALASGEIRSLLGLGFMALALHLKLLVEERFMREQFGARYEAYAARVKRLIPLFY